MVVLRNIVELCSFRSVYNDSLLKYLTTSKELSKDYKINSIYLDEEMKQFLSERHSNSTGKNKLSRVLAKIRFSKWLSRRFHFDKENDIVNIQFVSILDIFLVSFLNQNFNKIIISFWGSDLLRQKKWKLALLFPLFNICTYITFETDDMRQDFERRVSDKYSSKIKIVQHGSTVLDAIDGCSNNEIKSFKNKWNLPDDRKIIVIGYNGYRAQRHIAAIQSMMDAKINSDEVFIIFPWTYGNEDSSYRNEVEEFVSGKFHYVFLDEFLSDNEVASLRMITDILVQIQTTDALSSSMLETLYAGNAVITGKWLPYESALKKGLYLKLVDSPKDVGQALISSLHEDTAQHQVDQNKSIIFQLLSWKSNIEQWISLYVN